MSASTDEWTLGTDVSPLFDPATEKGFWVGFASLVPEIRVMALEHTFQDEWVKSTQLARMEIFTGQPGDNVLAGAPRALECLGLTPNPEYVREAAQALVKLGIVNYAIFEEAAKGGTATWKSATKVWLDMSAYRSTEDDGTSVLQSEIGAMFLRKPFSPSYITINTFGGDLCDMPFGQAMASLLRFYSQMTRNKSSTIFSRLNQFHVQVKDFVPPCSTCGTYKCRYSATRACVRDDALHLWTIVIELYQYALGDGHVRTMKGNIEPVGDSDNAGVYHHLDDSCAGLAWSVEAPEGEVLEVGDFDKNLFKRAKMDLRNYLGREDCDVQREVWSRGFEVLVEGLSYVNGATGKYSL